MLKVITEYWKSRLYQCSSSGANVLSLNQGISLKQLYRVYWCFLGFTATTVRDYLILVVFLTAGAGYRKLKQLSLFYLYRTFLQGWVGLRACTPIYPLHRVWRYTLNPSTCVPALWCVNLHDLFKVHFGSERTGEETIRELEWKDVFNESPKFMRN